MLLNLTKNTESLRNMVMFMTNVRTFIVCEIFTQTKIYSYANLVTVLILKVMIVSLSIMCK